MNRNTQPTIPVFDLQSHHEKVQVPTEFDMKDLARKYHIFPLKVISQAGRKRLLLAMRDPANETAVRDAEFRSGMSVIPVQADDKDIHWLIQTHYFGRKLSPEPSYDREIIHDLFQQLEITTDAQKQPDWVRAGIQPFTVEPTPVKKNS